MEMTATSRSAADILVAQRIVNNPAEFRRWEGYHDQLMRPVSAVRRLTEQMVALRATALALVHQRALFEYLRERRPPREKRRRLLAVFHGCADYTNALLTAHGNYIRCSSSFLCAQHLAEHLMHDPALDEPLALYEEWYKEYFYAYCDLEIAESEQEKAACLAQETFKPLLKYRVNRARKVILAMAAIPRDWREVRIRRPTGDTLCLRSLGQPDALSAAPLPPMATRA